MEAIDPIAGGVAVMRGQVVANVLAPIKTAEAEFEIARDAALRDKEEADDERRKIAADCGEIVDRLEHGGYDGGNIRDDLGNFAKSVEGLLSSTGGPS